jgi:multiple antibiotic resistance protein
VGDENDGEDMSYPGTLFGTAFAAFFAIMNPVANTPIFLGLTEGMDARTTRRIAFRSTALAFLIVAAFSVGGNYLLHLFGITLSSFRIAGGLLVALVGYHLLQGGHSPVHKSRDSDVNESEDASADIAVSPLAMPLLAGPGTLVTGMNYAAGSSPERLGVVLGAFLLICVLTYVCFIFGQEMTRFLGKSLVMVISRLMGLILSVIGTQMVIEGILGVMKGAGS